MADVRAPKEPGQVDKHEKVPGEGKDLPLRRKLFSEDDSQLPSSVSFVEEEWQKFDRKEAKQREAHEAPAHLIEETEIQNKNGVYQDLI